MSLTAYTKEVHLDLAGFEASVEIELEEPCCDPPVCPHMAEVTFVAGPERDDGAVGGQSVGIRGSVDQLRELFESALKELT